MFSLDHMNNHQQYFLTIQNRSSIKVKRWLVSLPFLHFFLLSWLLKWARFGGNWQVAFTLQYSIFVKCESILHSLFETNLHCPVQLYTSRVMSRLDVRAQMQSEWNQRENFAALPNQDYSVRGKLASQLCTMHLYCTTTRVNAVSYCDTVNQHCRVNEVGAYCYAK